MKKQMAAGILSVVLAVSLAACGSTGTQASAASGTSQVSAAAGTQAATQSSTAEGTAAAGSQAGTTAADSATAASTGSNAIIIYFDYSENMGDTSNMSVDAITSASLAGGTYDGVSRNDLQVMKDEIQKQTGADVFSVRVNEPYDPDYNNMVGQAQEDQQNDKQFTFVEDAPDLSSYDTVYLGMPVWWGGLPQPMVCFLRDVDFSGKTVIPFGIHLGSRFGRMVDQIKDLQPSASVSDDGLTENSHTPNAQVISDVDSWIASLN